MGDLWFEERVMRRRRIEILKSVSMENDYKTTEAMFYKHLGCWKLVES